MELDSFQLHYPTQKLDKFRRRGGQGQRKAGELVHSSIHFESEVPAHSLVHWNMQSEIALEHVHWNMQSEIAYLPKFADPDVKPKLECHGSYCFVLILQILNKLQPCSFHGHDMMT